MARTKYQAIENKGVNRTCTRLERGRAGWWKNEGISLWFAENKGDKKMTWLKFGSTPKCSTKISHLSL
jgi:hypothetical protein